MPTEPDTRCPPGTCQSCDASREIERQLVTVSSPGGLIKVLQMAGILPSPPNQTTPDSTLTIGAPQPQNDSKKRKEQQMSNAEKTDVKKDAANVEIRRKGTALIVPEELPLYTAITALTMRMEQEEQEVAINNEFDFGVAEGIVAMLRVLEREFGFVVGKASGGWFPSPPTFLGIEIEPGNQVQFPWGRLAMPGIDGYLEPNYSVRKDRVVFRISGKVKGKDRPTVDRIVQLVKDERAAHSIYRGHAISVDFPEIKDINALADTFPRFTKMNRVTPEDLVFSQSLADQMHVSLFTPIQRTEDCRKLSISLKRGILLEGPYGVGKTMTAAATATLCQENGWTYIYLKDGSQLAKAYEFAMQYQPAVIFAEDIDQILEADEEEEDGDDSDYDDDDGRNAYVNEILNALDGIDSKGVEIITVFTTNHVNRITRALLRPGRLDTVLSMTAPDARAAAVMARKFAGELLDPNTDMTSVGPVLAGMIPAMIREVVERSKLAALRRPGELTLVASDIIVTAHSMKAHTDLLEEPRADKRSDVEKAAAITAEAIRDAARSSHTNGKSENGYAAAVAAAPAE